MKNKLKPSKNSFLLEVEDGLQIVSIEGQFIIKGSDNILKKIKEIYNYINKPIYFDEVLQHFKNQNYLEDEINEIINFLKSNHLLIVEEKEIDNLYRNNFHQNFIEYLEISLKENFSSAVDKIIRTELLIISLSDKINVFIQNYLNPIGIRNINTIIIDNIKKDEVSNLDFYIKDQINSFSNVNKNSKKQKLVVLIIDGISPIIMNTVNKMCIEKELNLIFLNITPNFFEIGPTVIPGRTCCIECFIKEKESNMEYYYEYINIQKNFNEVGKYYIYTIPDIFRHVMYSFFIMELLNIVTYLNYPITYNNIIKFNFKTYDLKFHRVYKNPYCPICSNINSVPPRELYK